jgi:DNA invertase Pin-like site-specific DNA recombinase
MTPAQLLKKYGTQTAVAKAFGVSRIAVHKWVKAGAIPRQREWQLKAGFVQPPK